MLSGFWRGGRSEMFKIRSSGILRLSKIYCGKSMDRVLLVPCFDLNSSAPFVFFRADATNSPNFDFELWKVCRATSATPGHFKPFPLTSADTKTSCLAVDGGLVMNNPTAAAVTHVLHNKRDFPNMSGVEDLLVLSIGNGQPGSSARQAWRDLSPPQARQSSPDSDAGGAALGSLPTRPQDSSPPATLWKKMPSLLQLQPFLNRSSESTVSRWD